MVPRRRGFALVLLLALAAPIAAAAAPVRPKEMEARKAFAAGDWKQALQLFAALYAETLHPVYLRNIGRCHQKLRDPERAIDAFREYLVKNREVTAEERAEIDGYIQEMRLLQEERRARETAAAPPAGSQPALAPDLSPRPPPAPIVTAAPESPSRSPVYTRWWFWTGIGAAIAGGVVAAVLLSRSPGDVCPTGVNCQGMP